MTAAGARQRSPAAPPEDREKEAELWRRFSGRARDAREALFTFYYPFARQIARRRYLDRTSGDIELPDLCQMAYAGLLEAIDRYDPAVGVPFKGYAAKRIGGAIVDGIAKVSELREQISFRNRMRRERVRSLIDGDVDAMSAAQALEALIDAAVGLALGFMLDGEGQSTGAPRPSAATGYDSAVWRETVQRLLTEVTALPDRERAVIRHHYLEGLTIEQVAALMGLSKGRVSQLHRTAILTLKRRLARAGDFKLER
jgi:RNA polymerase sigma factor for flagellar operon FliA